jgi:hypothetical protein
VRIKSVTLYSLPYVVGVASFLVAAHQVAPTLNSIGLWDTNTKNEIFSGQTVNRSLKGNRLPIRHVAPHQAPERGQIKAPIPSKKPAEIVIAQHNGLTASISQM